MAPTAPRIVEYLLPNPIELGERRYEATVSFPEGTCVADVIDFQDDIGENLATILDGTDKTCFRRGDITIKFERLAPNHDFRVSGGYIIDVEDTLVPHVESLHQ